MHSKVAQPQEVVIPDPISREDCRRLVNQQAFCTPDGESHSVQLNTMNVFHSEDVGTITTSEGGIACQGQAHRKGGYIVQDICNISQFRVTIKEEDLLAEGP